APNMSWLSTKMEQAGLVTKTRDSADARVVVLALTESAWAALEVAVPLVSAVEAQLLQHLTVQELRTLADLLGRLVTSD
ncbi:MAG TPA: hypothetical protein VMM13_04625, partial [Euzebya sp.]|nr:hypothetical protein [Euzebya sp.]